MGRTRAYRRSVRNRAIAHKKRIWKSIWKEKQYIPDGKFSKAHMGCGCWLCKPWKHQYEPSRSEIRDTVRARQCIDDYLNNR